MGVKENPGAYQETINRLREEKEKEQRLKEHLFENFEKKKEILKLSSRFDVFELKRRIETARSAQILSQEIEKALKEGVISRNSYDVITQKLERRENSVEKNESINANETSFFDENSLPFSQTDLAKFFESKKIGENWKHDIAGFAYGFFVQGGAIFIILLYKIIFDIVFFPRDIIQHFKK